MRQLRPFAVFRRKPPAAAGGAPNLPAAEQEAPQAAFIDKMPDASWSDLAPDADAKKPVDSGREAASRSAGLAICNEELAASGAIAAAMDIAAQKTRDAVSWALAADVAITDLTAATEEIVGIIDTIASVARQSNLLALNAAIEAARAGPAGRHFASVAEEVKSLSLETSNAAQDMRARIIRLRDNAGQSMRSVEKAVSVIQEVQPVFDAVRSAVHERKASLAKLAEPTIEVWAGARMSERAKEIDTALNAAAARISEVEESRARAEALARVLGDHFTVVRQNEAEARLPVV